MSGSPIIPPRVAFLGEKPLAEICLEDLVRRRCQIVAICTREKDDGLWWGKNRVKEIARLHNLPILRRAELKSIRPDILISVLYPFIIEKEIVESAKSAFNLHLAPLPEYKGCNTGSHALIKGDRQFGVTFHEMTEALDSGRLVEKRYFPLGRLDTARTLYDKANETGWAVWLKNIDDVLEGRVQLLDVNDDGSAPYDRRSLENKHLPKATTRLEIYNFVRGLDFEPFEPAYFINKEEKIYLRQKDFDPESLQLRDPFLEAKLQNYLEASEG